MPGTDLGTDLGLDILVKVLPEIARAVAAPLAKTGSITMVSTGGKGTGASKLTRDVTRIMAELPAVVESLSGIELRKLFESVPALKDVMRKRPEKESPAE